MSKKVISTSDAPAAIGPYSQAIAANGFLFCSGQIALHPQSGELVGVGDITQQTKQVMENLGAVLRAGGSSFEDVVKCGIFLESMDDFAAVNAVYATYFEGMEPPARACVAVRTLPKNVAVEVEAIALLSE
ncbi:MAG: 2-iminobutanoate/2-iminopropanoate deaminase [Polyangiales bacterium]|jgi:2-iminobutanoate/2-iminopropanoate deaminase